MGNFTGKYVTARKSFGYGRGSRLRDVGEVFKLVGMRNDDKLWGLKVDGKPKLGRYTEPFIGDIGKLPKCSECGAMFISHARLELHGKLRHKRK